ncbi:transcriptional regulator [soil metagenome]
MALGKKVMTHPSRSLDEVIHQKNRLGILAVLAEADFVDFGYLKEVLDLTDGNLSRHLSVLEEQGLVSIKKTFEGRKPRTIVDATRRGRKALNEHLRAMQELINRVGVKEK